MHSISDMRVGLIFVLLTGVPLVAFSGSIMVGDIEIDPDDFSEKHKPGVPGAGSGPVRSVVARRPGPVHEKRSQKMA